MSDTHSVFNQSTPFVDVNLYAVDSALQQATRVLAQPSTEQQARLSDMGQRYGSAQAQQWAIEANANKPSLKAFDRFGHRIDEVSFHPAYHQLMHMALSDGLHASPWAQPGAGAQVHRAAAYYLFSQLENGVQCPVTMTFAVVPVMARHPQLAADWLPRLLANDYDPRLTFVRSKKAVTMGMGMTEKQGGSDVRSNTTLAQAVGMSEWGEQYQVTGHKWFFSAPMCDAFLILAQTDPGSSAGLTCFFLPRVLPDGSLNRIRIQRLKDKIGNHSNASSEVEFDAASAWRVGEVGRGIPTILEMGNHTRLDCTIGSAGLLRAGVSQAIHHARARSAFGRRLSEHDLMQTVLADLSLESEAAMWLALRLARTYDAQASESELALRRILTPAAKYWVCKRTPQAMAEAMEVTGGAGYVEEGPFGRLFRESPLNSIWEGSGNVMCLDVLRALARGPQCQEALQQEWQGARGFHADWDAAYQDLVSTLAHPQHSTDEAAARGLTEQLALLMQASLLIAHAPESVAVAFCQTRLSRKWRGTLGSAPIPGAAAIVERALSQG
ncbi:MAG: DNA alkylation response protein [Betaproteobacteria bacterium]|jgi:putative acyl-CoA dehydrogenase|nr:DNA alkylation response protein [Betaproteobacteria bacterium]NBP43896.1 DNA alkylation response protein [Betaproteobacteria bacterium]